ncbi:MAG: cation:proton antiporter [Actinobacteria bacterium]|nr:MAG: cation:proton antiporter [Actinomycetota bacterium]
MAMIAETGQTLVYLLILFVAAKGSGEVFERFRLPAMIGEIIAGIIIGPFGLALVARTEASDVLATLGVIILLFAVGLQTRVDEVIDVGREAGVTAALGVAIPFASVFLLMRLLGAPLSDDLFVATAVVATSVGITARILLDLNAIDTPAGRIVLGAAVIDDVLGLLILSVVVAFVATQTLKLLDLAIVVLQVAAFIVFSTAIAPKLVRRHASLIERLKIANAPLVVALGLMLGLSALSSFLGLSAIVGAFLAGTIFAETEDRFYLSRRVTSLTEFLAPFFFIVTGTLVNVRVLLTPSVLGVGLAITALAIAGKVAGGLIGAGKRGLGTGLLVGVGMVPRGEVGLIVATIGASAGVISEAGLSQLVFMAIATTLAVAPVLPPLVARTRRIEAEAEARKAA